MSPRALSVRRRSCGAFTLIEVLTAITIALLIVGAVSYIFSQATRVFATAQGRLQIDQQARAVFDLMERDLQGAMSVKTGVQYCYFVGTDATIKFVSTSGSQGMDLVEALYHFDPTTKRLYRAVRTDNTRTPSGLAGLLLGGIPTSGLSEDAILVEKVTAIPGQKIFRYSADGTTFTDAWTLDGAGGLKPLPRAIRVSLRISDSTDRFREDMSRTIWIPRGR